MTWPTDPLQLVDARTVAARLCYGSVQAFYQDKPARLKAGFPTPVRGRHWTAYQIDHWLKQRSAGHSAPTAANDDAVKPVAAPNIRARLEGLRKGATRG